MFSSMASGCFWAVSCAAGGLMLALILLLVNRFSAVSAKSSILVYVASAIGAKHSWFLSLGAFARSKQIG